MKICFVAFECESYAIMLFSALLKKQGHQVNLIFDPRLFATDEISNNLLFKIFDIRRQNLEKIKQINPDLIGFSVYTQDYQYALFFARMIKKETSIPIIFGGIHCILCPEQVIKEDCIDYVCVGEGEKTIMDLAAGEKYPDNVWMKDREMVRRFKPIPLIKNLDTLPFIDRDIFYEQKPVFKRDYSISTGRGCPYTCAFCASEALGRMYKEKELGKYVRQRSVKNVIEELKLIKEKYRPHSIYFTDDVFTLDSDWLEHFSTQYLAYIRLPFYCTANPATIRDKDIYNLALAGCQMIGFGMQSCSEQIRKDILKRYGSNERIEQTINTCRLYGIKFSFDHIFDIPTEPEENQIEAIKFYNKTRPDIINTFNMTYLPKIELNKYLDENTKRLVEEGKIRTMMFNKKNDDYSSIFTLIPLLPKGWIDMIINKRLIKFIKIPFLIRLFLKDIKRLLIGRYSDVFFPINLLFTNIRDNIWIKFFDNKYLIYKKNDEKKM